MSSYHDRSYWSARYQLDAEPFEWYQPFSALRGFIAPLLVSAPSQADSTPAGPPRSRGGEAGGRQRVLVLGCGVSDLSVEVWKLTESKAEVTSVDFSVECIDECSRRWPPPLHPGLTFTVKDVRSLDFPTRHFDLILDKATLDCLHCSDVSDADDDIRRVMASIHRILKPQGALLSLSHSPPHQRVPAFRITAIDVWKEAHSHEKREKEKHRSSLLKTSAPSTPLTKSRASIHLRALAGEGSSRRGDTASGARVELGPLPVFSQPQVHRIDKVGLVKPASPNLLRQRASVPMESSGESGHGEGEEGLKGEEGAFDDADAELNLSAMEEQSHYVYITFKEASDAGAGLKAVLHSVPRNG